MQPDTFPYRASDYTIEIVLQPTTDGEQVVYFATVVELPGCDSDGATPEEARRNLIEAFDLYTKTALADGVSLPPPSPRKPGRLGVKEMVWAEYALEGAA
jgi:predicted RNase H-like HicB family nuclease